MLATLATAQIHLSLTLLDDGKTYQVAMTPESTWESPKNTTGSVQVVVAAPVGEGFLVKDLKSQVPGVTWLDDTYVESPPAAPGWTFISFVIKELGTKAFRYEAGVETPLFTFRSASGDCANGLQLLSNDDPMVRAVVKDKFNVTQSLTVLGMRGNAFNGLVENKVECPEQLQALPESWVSEIKASPLPAASFVDFKWVNGEGLQSLELQLFNEKGQIIKQHKLNTNPGAQTFHAETDRMSQGLYSATFIANGKQRQTLRLTVMP